MRKPTQAQNPVITATNLTKIYGRGDTAVRALDDVSVTIEKGRFTAIMGPSGSGKSTLMHCLAGLDRIDRGHVRLGEIELSGLSQRRLTRLRRDRIGFIFQAFNLVPSLSAAENITLPSDLAKRRVKQEELTDIARTLGLEDRLHHRPSELSGGQQQRVAIARALLSRPDVVFADEPTGNLDSQSTVQVLRYLRRVVDEFNQTIVMVTHEPQAASYADTVLFLTDGQVVAQLDEPDEDRVLDALRAISNNPATATDQPPAAAVEAQPGGGDEDEIGPPPPGLNLAGGASHAAQPLGGSQVASTPQSGAVPVVTPAGSAVAEAAPDPAPASAPASALDPAPAATHAPETRTPETHAPADPQLAAHLAASLPPRRSVIPADLDPLAVMVPRADEPLAGAEPAPSAEPVAEPVVDAEPAVSAAATAGAEPVAGVEPVAEPVAEPSAPGTGREAPITGSIPIVDPITGAVPQVGANNGYHVRGVRTQSSIVAQAAADNPVVAAILARAQGRMEETK